MNFDDFMEWCCCAGGQAWNNVFYFLTGDDIWNKEEQPVVIQIQPVSSEENISKEVCCQNGGDKNMARIKAPKTLKNFLKKVFNPDLTINEDFNRMIIRNNFWEDPDWAYFWDDRVVLKSISELEVIYNNSISGKRWFFSIFDLDEEEYNLVVWDKPRNRWEQYEDPQNVKKYEIKTQILKDYLILPPSIKKKENFKKLSRFEIMEIG